MSTTTIIVTNPKEGVRDRMAKAIEIKRQIKLYIKTNGTAKGIDIPGVRFIKPL